MAILQFLAQATQPATGAAAPWWFKDSQWLPLLAMVAIFYFIMFRSKKGKDKKVKDMLSQLKRGDEIQTIGGIIGTVVDARETEVIVKVDETNNTKMKFSRNAIHRVIEPKK